MCYYIYGRMSIGLQNPVFMADKQNTYELCHRKLFRVLPCFSLYTPCVDRVLQNTDTRFSDNVLNSFNLSKKQLCFYNLRVSSVLSLLKLQCLLNCCWNINEHAESVLVTHEINPRSTASCGNKKKSPSVTWSRNA